MSFVIVIAMSFVQDFADFLDENSDKVIKLGVNEHCNSSIAICSASIMNEGEFQRISFSIKHLPDDQDVKIMLTAKGFDFEGIESISVLFEVLDEDIESPAIVLIPDKSSHQIVAEKWNAVARLPVIKGENRDWRAIVSLKSTKKEYRAEFPFDF